MSSFLNKLNLLFNKQATELNIIPPSTPMPPEQAPNYKKAESPLHMCSNCAFYKSPTSYCDRYNFQAEQNYICDSWQTKDLNLTNIKLGSFKTIKATTGQTFSSAELNPQTCIQTQTKQSNTQQLQTVKPVTQPQIQQPTPNTFQQTQQQPQNTFKPSVVAQLQKEKGGLDATQSNILNMFTNKQANNYKLKKSLINYKHLFKNIYLT